MQYLRNQNPSLEPWCISCLSCQETDIGKTNKEIYSRIQEHKFKTKNNHFHTSPTPQSDKSYGTSHITNGVSERKLLKSIIEEDSIKEKISLAYQSMIQKYPIKSKL